MSAPTDPLGTLSDSGAFSRAGTAPIAASVSSSSAALPQLTDLLEETLDEEAAEAHAEQEVEGLIDVAEALALQDEVPEVPTPEGFVVSRTRGGHCRRLHFMGGCFRIPGEHYRQFDSYGQQYPSPDLFDLRCKDCFPADRPAARSEEAKAEACASDGSGSDSASSADEDPAEGLECVIFVCIV